VTATKSLLSDYALDAAAELLACLRRITLDR
jgi:hypothetical protein